MGYGNYCSPGGRYVGFPGTRGKRVRGVRVGGGALAGATFQEAQESLFAAQILRFMGDPHLYGARENVFGNYIVQKGLAVPELRDEILAQLANQVWRNPSAHNAERGWLLLATCLSAFAPSARLSKYLLK